MEPNLVRKDIKYQKKTLAIVSVLVISLFMGGSFALLSNSSETGEVVTFKTGNFNLEATTTGTLSLEGEAPKSYDDGFKNNDITLTLTNTGSLEIGKYDVKLEGDSTTTLESNYIRYSVSDDEGKTYLASKLLSETDNIIYTGYNLKDTKVLKVKLWIDEAAGENALKKSYNGKINVELYQNDDTLVDVVKSKLVSNYSGSKEDFNGGLIAVNNDSNLYHEVNNEEIREYRYSGPKTNNYIKLTDNNGTEEDWRIIGIFKDESENEYIRVVRDTVLPESYLPANYVAEGTIYKIKGSGTGAYWNYQAGDTSDKNDWSSAGLQYYLNGEQDTSGNRGFLSYLSSNVKRLLETKKLYLGTITYVNNQGVTDTTKQSYKHERATDCNNGVGTISSSDGFTDSEVCRVWNGNAATASTKVSLMYPSDYGFSALSSYWDSTTLSNYMLKGKETSWMYSTMSDAKDKKSSLISPLSTLPYFASRVRADGSTTGCFVFNAENAVRPVLNLSGTLTMVYDGEGTSTNPYSLILN